ncbi:MAG: hypothetical protein VXW65_10855 [Pseudomonadota bacterium]|nr:hypothetical protein [Pseudomonadota bacterium]
MTSLHHMDHMTTHANPLVSRQLSAIAPLPFAGLFDQHSPWQQLSDQYGVIGVINTVREQIWLLTDRHSICFEQGFSTEALTDHPAILLVTKTPQDLRQWLWQNCWQAPQAVLSMSVHDRIELAFWPQPCTTDRRVVLKLCAHLHQQPCSTQELADRTGVDLARVQHFIAALVVAGLARSHMLAKHVTAPHLTAESQWQSIA